MIKVWINIKEPQVTIIKKMRQKKDMDMKILAKSNSSQTKSPPMAEMVKKDYQLINLLMIHLVKELNLRNYSSQHLLMIILNLKSNYNHQDMIEVHMTKLNLDKTKEKQHQDMVYPHMEENLHFKQELIKLVLNHHTKHHIKEHKLSQELNQHMIELNLNKNYKVVNMINIDLIHKDKL